jgi:hypothetical protein
MKRCNLHSIIKARYVAVAMLQLLALSSCEVSGCSLIPIPPIDVDPKEVAFTGRVVGIVQRSQDGVGPTWGLKVRVHESILPPHALSSEYFVYPFWLGTDCAKVPVDKSWLLKSYPVGSSVWVIGSHLEAAESEQELEVWEGTGGHMDMNVKPNRTTAKSVFVYERGSDDFISEFELRKDLLRLSQSPTPQAKEAILRRIAFYRWFRVQEEAFSRLVYHHLRDKILAERVMRFYEQEVKGDA